MPASPGAAFQPDVAGYPGPAASGDSRSGRSTPGSFLAPPAVAAGGSTVARQFTAAGSNKIALSPGALAGAPFDYGTLAFVCSFTSSAAWQDIFSLRSASGTGESGCIEISPGTPGNLWVAVEDINGTYGPLFGTGDYCVVITKPTGSAIGRYHVYNGTAWSHGDLTVAQPNGTANITSIVIGEYPGGFDYCDSKLSVVGAFRHWVPNDAAVEAAQLHVNLQKWVDAAPNGDRSFVASLNQASTGTAVVDNTGGGADQTALTGTTVATGPAWFDNSLGSPVVPVESSGAAIGGATARATAAMVASSASRATGGATGRATAARTAATSSRATGGAAARATAARTAPTAATATGGGGARAGASRTAVLGASVADTFTGTNGDDWDPTKWLPAQGNLTGSTSDIQTDRGRIQTTTGAYAALTRRSRLPATLGPVETLVKVAFPSGSEWYAGLWLRASSFTIFSDTQPADGYVVEPSLNYLSLDRVIGGTRSGVTADLTGKNYWGTTQWVKTYTYADAIKIKVWPDGTAEPDGWDIDTVDPIPVTTPGEVGVYQYSGAAVETVATYFDNFSAAIRAATATGGATARATATVGAATPATALATGGATARAAAARIAPASARATGGGTARLTATRIAPAASRATGGATARAAGQRTTTTTARATGGALARTTTVRTATAAARLAGGALARTTTARTTTTTAKAAGGAIARATSARTAPSSARATGGSMVRTTDSRIASASSRATGGALARTTPTRLASTSSRTVGGALARGSALPVGVTPTTARATGGGTCRATATRVASTGARAAGCGHARATAPRTATANAKAHGGATGRAGHARTSTPACRLHGAATARATASPVRPALLRAHGAATATATHLRGATATVAAHGGGHARVVAEFIDRTVPLPDARATVTLTRGSTTGNVRLGPSPAARWSTKPRVTAPPPPAVTIPDPPEVT